MHTEASIVLSPSFFGLIPFLAISHAHQSAFYNYCCCDTLNHSSIPLHSPPLQLPRFSLPLLPRVNSGIAPPFPSSSTSSIHRKAREEIHDVHTSTQGASFLLYMYNYTHAQALPFSYTRTGINHRHTQTQGQHLSDVYTGMEAFPLSYTHRKTER